jgi:hypothetical protein
MAYDVWTGEVSGRDFSINLPEQTNAGSWLTDQITGETPWTKIAAVGGGIVGSLLLVGWLTNHPDGESPPSDAMSRAIDFVQKAHSPRPAHPGTTKKLPAGETMADVVFKRLK